MRQETIWTWRDLGFFLGAIFPAVLLSGILTSWIGNTDVRRLAYQTVLYFLLIGALAGLAHVRHEKDLARATSWTLRFHGVWWCVTLAPLIALVATVLIGLWRAPLVPSAVDQLAVGAIPLPIVSLFAVVIGPLFEELTFRGFLQPLLQVKWGPRIGLLITAAAFSCLHGQLYEWHWQYLLVLFLVGSAFGLARHRTGSTAASFMLHMGYNLTQLTGAIVSRS